MGTRRTLTKWGALLGLVGAACGEPAASPGGGGDGLPDVSRVFAAVSRVRELSGQRVPTVRFLRRTEYLTALQRSRDAEQEGVEAFASKLGLAAAPPAVRDEKARLLGSIGIYSQEARTIYVLDDPSRRFPILLEQVVAHEAVHALQDQNGLLPDPHQDFSADEALARRALIEGDATLGELLYEQRDWRTPTRRIAERVRRGFAEQPISEYVSATSPGLEGSPAYQQEIVSFPYRAGSAFVGALLATGGYGLVAQAFANPPRATAQILHPERYAGGESPVAIPPLPLPTGYTLRTSTVLGELLTRSLLLRCSPAKRAIEGAEGWRGDLLLVMQGKSELVAQQWLMNSEQDAHELANLLRVSCAGLDAPTVTETGSRVVAIRGADDALGTQLANRWLSLPIVTPALARPLGSTELLALPPRRPVREPFTQTGTFHVPAAGIELPIPDGFESMNHPTGLKHRDGHATIELYPMLGEYFPDAPHQLVNEVSRSMELSIAFSNVVEVGKPYPVTLRLGRALALNFEHDGTVARGRVLAIARCGGAGLLGVVQYYGSEKSAEDEALRAMTADDDDEYCRELTRGTPK